MDFQYELALSLASAFLLFAFRLLQAVDNEALSLIFKFNLSNLIKVIQSLGPNTQCLNYAWQ